MKKIVSTALFALFMASAIAGFSQEPKDTVKVGEGIDRTAKKVGKATAKTAKKVGNATASTASKAASKVADKTYKGKSGPAGQTIYIDKYSKYYYVDSKGRKVYLTEAELKEK